MPLDTIGIVVDSARNWVYDEEKKIQSLWSTLEYAPCGNGRPIRYSQKRVCSINGIIEERYRIVKYKYIPRPKSDFEKVIEAFKK